MGGGRPLSGQWDQDPNSDPRTCFNRNRRDWPKGSDDYELIECCGEGASASVRVAGWAVGRKTAAESCTCMLHVPVYSRRLPAQSHEDIYDVAGVQHRSVEQIASQASRCCSPPVGNTPTQPTRPTHACAGVPGQVQAARLQGRGGGQADQPGDGRRRRGACRKWWWCVVRMHRDGTTTRPPPTTQPPTPTPTKNNKTNRTRLCPRRRR